MAEQSTKLPDVFLEPPRLSVLSDDAITPDDLRADHFDLGLRVGPIYDIVRHPDTRTPMTIAIYGEWGAGKTSAMKWLDLFSSSSVWTTWPPGSAYTTI